MVKRSFIFLTCALLALCQLYAQGERTIRGMVVNEQNEPLVGVAILLSGTTQGTTTDVDGQFRLVINKSTNANTIEVSYVGMKSKTVSIASYNQPLRIVLLEDAKLLEDVVVTGYQTVSKERATGAFGTISSAKLENKLSADLKNVLEGQMAGVVLDKDGQISIRGISTLNAENQPLVVVDGYPTECSLSDLNPDNIENVTVLKDGVAASIYGSRSANGVIVVTTKTGKKGKPTISYRGTFKFEPKPNLDNLHMASTSDYIDAQLDLYNQNSSGHVISKKSNNMNDVDYLLIMRDAGKITADMFDRKIAELRKNDVLSEMEKYMFRTAFTQTHNVSINGGSDMNRYNLAVNYTKNRGAFINTEDDRLLVDLKNEWNPYKFLTIGIAANINYNRSTSPKTGWQTFTDFSSYVQPYTRLKDDQGNLTNIRTNSYAVEEMYNSHTGMKGTDYNPITDAYQDYIKTNNFSTRFSGFLRFDIWDGLTAEVGGNWSRGNSTTKKNSEEDSYMMRLAYNNSTSLKVPSDHYIPLGDMINETRSVNESWTVRTQINYNNQFGKHRVSALVGNEVRRLTFDNNTYETRLGYNSTAGSFIPVNMKDLKGGKYNSDMINGNSLQNSLTYGAYNLQDNRFVSWYFNGAYEYDNRYLISGSIREDLTNFFGTDPKYRHKPMWSIGGTWKLNHEAFFDIDWIDRLYVRASYGINGNISLSEGPYLILKPGSFNNDTGGMSYGIASYPNNSLRWEKTKTTNIGFDLDVLNGRLGISLDYYLKKSSDLLAKNSIDPTLGTSSMTQNVGAIDNKGIEISLHGTPIQNKNFKWNSIFNMSINKNKVKEYNVNRNYPTSWAYTTPIHAEGYPMYGFFGYNFAGLDNQGRVQFYRADGSIGLINEATKDDVVYQGTAIPKTDFSFTNEFTYKNWNLSFMIIAKFGHKYRKDCFQGSNYNNRYVGQRWQKPGDEEHTIYPVLRGWNSDLFYFPFCDVNIGNASYAKLRDVTLSYTFDKSLINRIGLSNARIYLQARNLFRITAKECDVDPETFENNLSGGMGAFTNAGFSTLPMSPEFYIGFSFSL